jgi:phenylpyruvate tautomerase PptA (4-oxalocrotonate tautomerase family)
VGSLIDCRRSDSRVRRDPEDQVLGSESQRRITFIQVTLAEGHDAATKRAFVTQVPGAAAAATGTLEEAFRVWIIEVSPDEVSAGGTALADRHRDRDAIEKGEATR